MELVKHEIIERLASIVGREVELVADSIQPPPTPEMGDLAFPCFPLAKVMGKSPAAVADDLVGVLRHQLDDKPARFIADVKAAGPYLNFTVKTKEVAEVVLNPRLSLKPSFFGIKARLQGDGRRTIMVEYGQPNTHKEFHVGHLRNVLVGQAISNLLLAVGHKVIQASYIGDTGAHVAKCLWALTRFHMSEAELFLNQSSASKDRPPQTGRTAWLGKIYAEADRRLRDNKEAMSEVRALDRTLELKQDRKLVALWKKTRNWSLAEFKAIFRELGARFDVFYYESELEHPGQEAVDDLLRRKIAVLKDGAVMVDLTAEKLDEYVLRRKDGTSLYSTKDIALAALKFKKYRLDESLYVVDARQSFHFKQLFRTLALAGFKQPMRHVSYEFVTLPEGSMSSRSGNVVSYESFRDEVISRARTETTKRHPEWAKKKIEATSRAIAFAAIRYELHRYDLGREIIFDVQRALSFDGATGPYLLYTLARINGILRKAKVKSKKAKDISEKKKEMAGGLWSSADEKQLLLALARYPEAVVHAARDLKPSLAAQYLFELAKTFTAFYEQCPVLAADAALRRARLRLVRAVAATMARGLALLGIQSVREM